MSISKEEMALEALIKLVVELENTVTSYHVTRETMKYAHDALKANGWIVVGNEWNISKHRKIDAKTMESEQ